MHPRTELHVHLDGSIPPATLLRISRRRNLTLPGLAGRVPESIDDIWTALQSMIPVWHRFDLVNEIIGGDEATLSEIAEEFVDRQAAQHVSYTEVRWDPVRPAVSHLANASIGVETAVRAVERGLRAGSERHGNEVYQILCAMRGSPGSACFELADLAATTRSGALGGVVGMDLAGDEYHFNNSQNHVEQCFRYAKTKLLLNTTVHAGEAYTDVHKTFADVRSAVEKMLADRIGHGYAAVQDGATLDLLARRRVHLEACPAGGHAHRDEINLPATGVYQQRGLSFGMSTDDPAVYFANVSLSEVEALVRSRLNFTDADISRAYSNARAASFAADAARIVSMQNGSAALGGGGTHRGADAGVALLTTVGVIASVGFFVLLARAVIGKRQRPREMMMSRMAV